MSTVGRVLRTQLIACARNQFDWGILKAGEVSSPDRVVASGLNGERKTISLCGNRKTLSAFAERKVSHRAICDRQFTKVGVIASGLKLTEQQAFIVARPSQSAVVSLELLYDSASRSVRR